MKQIKKDKIMNYIILFILAWNFGFLTLIPLLAQSFLRAQGLGSAESGIVLIYSEHFGLSRKRRDREKESLKTKTKPKQTQSKPIFWRTKPILSPKMRIFDKFRNTFLCKTKPIWKNCLLSMMYHFNKNMQNEPNGMLFKPYSKPKNRLFDKFMKPFYAKRTQWYVIQTKFKPNLFLSSTYFEAVS